MKDNHFYWPRILLVALAMKKECFVFFKIVQLRT